MRTLLPFLLAVQVACGAGVAFRGKGAISGKVQVPASIAVDYSTPIQSLPGAVVVYDMTSIGGGRLTNLVADNFRLTLGTGTGSDADDPTSTSEGLSFAASPESEYATDTGTMNLTNCSIYAVIKRTGAAYSTDYGQILTRGSSTITDGFSLMDHYQTRMPYFAFNGQGVWADTVWLDDNRWHLLAGTYDGTTLRMYLDGVEVAAKSTSVSYVTIANLMLSQQFRSFHGVMAYAAVFNVAHSASEQATMLARFANKVSGRGITLAAPTRFIVFEGDSITDPLVHSTLDGKYSYQSATNRTPYVAGRNFAVSGNTIADLTARAASVDALYSASRGTNNILSVLIGANDMGAGLRTAAEYFADLKAYCLARKAIGHRIIVCTVLPNYIEWFEDERIAANAMIRADTSFYDALADFGADPTIGDPDAPADAGLYPDGLHPSASAHVIMAGIHSAALDILLGPP